MKKFNELSPAAQKQAINNEYDNYLYNTIYDWSNSLDVLGVFINEIFQNSYLNNIVFDIERDQNGYLSAKIYGRIFLNELNFYDLYVHLDENDRDEFNRIQAAYSNDFIYIENNNTFADHAENENDCAFLALIDDCLAFKLGDLIRRVEKYCNEYADDDIYDDIYDALAYEDDNNYNDNGEIV